MKRSTLLRRSLLHRWRTNLAVLMGVVAATAVIGGALLVGDSVRDSLRQMSLDRLGGVDHALVGQRFFGQPLAEELLLDPEAINAPAVAPALVLTGGIVHEEDEETTRAAGISIYGTDDRLWKIWSSDSMRASVADLTVPNSDGVTINRRLADTLQVETGDQVSLLIEIPTAIPRDSLLGDRSETVTELPLTVTFIAQDETTPGRFGLNPAQQLPLNAFVNLETLQRQLGMQHVPATPRNPVEKPGRINAMFVDADHVSADELTVQLNNSVTLADLLLRLESYDEQAYISLESDQMILEDAVGEAAAEVAEEMGLVTSPVLVYLLNEMSNPKDATQFSMYSVMAGIEFDKPAPFGPLEFTIGGLPTVPGEVVLNDWLADDLGITQAGQSITVMHKVVGDRGELPDVQKTWTVSGVVKLDGPAADPHYTPFVEGITDAEDYGDWREPFPMQQERVTGRDHDFWDEYKTTPKLFLTLNQAQELFASRYGKLSSFRFAPTDDHPLEEVSAEFGRRLLEKLTTGSPPASGLVFQPVKEQGLAAASGTTDFTGLFIGFSFFLIAAALLLIGLLFRLGIERRVSEYGLLSAVGLSPRDVRRLFLSEVGIIAVLGGLLGCAAAVGYAGLMVYGLKTWWFGAIGTKFLFLSVRPLSLVTGFLIAVVMSILTAWWTLWRMRDVSTRQMLSGLSEAPIQESDQRERGRRSRSTAMVCGAIAAVLLVATLLGLVPASEAFGGFNWRVVSFFVIGMASLVGSLSLLAWRLDAGESSNSVGANLSDVVSLGFRNAARHRGRSVLTASLIASATFVIVAVAAGRRNPAVEEPVNASGNGGFTLLAESSTPVLYDLNTPRGRADAGFDLANSDAEELIDSMRVMPFRVRPGEDASCLNLYQTQLPTILGVPDDVIQSMIDDDRFRFADTPGDEPWTLLNEELPEGRIPVLGDMNTLMYSLHKGIGATIEVPTEAGTPEVLEVAGMFDGSVFQGVLLMSESHFLELFPDREGFGYFLIETKPERSDELATLLETQLADYGFDVTRVADRLADFLAVQNTYLSTFQTLGGLGLLLGTLGLGTVMLRNVLERRGEFALLRAVGFRHGAVTKMVLAENTFVLLWGLAAGTLSALLAMGPHLMTTGADVPWIGLELMLLGVFAVGMCAALLAVREAVRTPIVETLRAER